MLQLHATNRCKLFELISNEIWLHLIYNHSVSVNVSEIGVTYDIIAAIRANHNRIPNFGVWANPGHKESINGSDIDIFVETAPGQFLWFALQAKVLKTDGTYHNMRRKTNNEFQWEKLQNLAKKSGCIVRYLLYNGLSDYQYSGNDCKGNFSEEQFGCSLVTANEVAKIAMTKDPTFYDFHHKKANPWREIVCCKRDLSKHTLFSIVQVKNSISYYEEVFDDSRIEDQDFLEDKQNDLSLNAINEISEENNRVAVVKIIVRRTDSKYQQQSS